MKYEIGQKIYYKGDMANRSGWFVIVGQVNDRFLKGYDLQERGGDRKIRSLPEVMIHDVDAGHGGTRFVTEEAYNKRVNGLIKEFEESMRERGVQIG